MGLVGRRGQNPLDALDGCAEEEYVVLSHRAERCPSLTLLRRSNTGQGRPFDETSGQTRSSTPLLCNEKSTQMTMSTLVTCIRTHPTVLLQHFKATPKPTPMSGTGNVLDTTQLLSSWDVHTAYD